MFFQEVCIAMLVIVAWSPKISSAQNKDNETRRQLLLFSCAILRSVEFIYCRWSTVDKCCINKWTKWDDAGSYQNMDAISHSKHARRGCIVRSIWDSRIRCTTPQPCVRCWSSQSGQSQRWMLCSSSQPSGSNCAQCQSRYLQTLVTASIKQCVWLWSNGWPCPWNMWLLSNWNHACFSQRHDQSGSILLVLDNAPKSK